MANSRASSDRVTKEIEERRSDDRVQTVLTGANITPLGKREPTPTISFDDRDMRGQTSGRDEPMVISVVATEYKMECVLIDQGSSANILYRSTLERMQLPADLCVPILGTVELETCFGERLVSRTIPVLYTVVDAPASYIIIIGRPALNRLGAIVSTKHLCMKFPMGRKVGSAWADTHVEKYASLDKVNALDLDLDPRSQFEREGPLPAEDLKEVQLGPRQEQIMKIRTTMSQKEEDMLITILKANYDVFAWSARDMLGVDPSFMCHQLSIDEQAKPVAQKKRKQREEKREAVREETRKLLSAGFVREVQYPTWLANIVMVRKSNGKWRMCTDYTDLNKACPKDSYPLPSIDRLVDNVAGFTFLSFMDAYSGYNQIRMHPQDEEKIAFITDEGAFCYKVMSFSLKNAGATYQCLMDKIFGGILGTDVEVYVDDMVAKSQGMGEHCEALGQRTSALIESKQVLIWGASWEVSRFHADGERHRGKPREVLGSNKHEKPQKPIHGKGHSVSPLHFKGGQNVYTFVCSLKKGGRFTWTDECEEAFLRLKAIIAAPPVLIRPKPGTPLYLYISVSDTAVSSALIQEEGGEQRLVYFISKVLQGPEKRYQKIEKAALAVMIASRCLRPYFQNFSIIVRMDLPIRQVLRKLDMAGRMVAWSVQLSKFDISFERRGHCHNLNCDVRLGEPRPCRPQRSRHRRFGLGNARKPNGKAGLESEIWVRELVTR
ncbi:Retrovirus-related Pol polyprotein from transposon 17.6, partial [Mucuna pruriens]